MDGTHGLDLTGAIEIVTCHAEGEVGDVIVGGVEPPPGATLWEQARWIDQDETLRNLVLNEPRGGVFRHVNLLVPSRLPDVEWGFIIMEPCHTPPMSGSNSMCVATVLLETGRVPMVEPITRFTMEAPGGTVSVEAECRTGRLNGSGWSTSHRSLIASTPLSTCPASGRFESTRPSGATALCSSTLQTSGWSWNQVRLPNSLKSAHSSPRPPTNNSASPTPYPEWSHLSFCQIAGPLERTSDGFELQSTSVIDPGKLDRSPTGTGVSARLAVLHARGLASVGDRLTCDR